MGKKIFAFLVMIRRNYNVSDRELSSAPARTVSPMRVSF